MHTTIGTCAKTMTQFQSTSYIQSENAYFFRGFESVSGLEAENSTSLFNIQGRFEAGSGALNRCPDFRNSNK